MKILNITAGRLNNQHISRPDFNTPAEVVQCLGAVQAQDYAAAKWAVGLRMKDGSDAGLDRALTDGTIIRTHVLRPTWHFVSPTDVRWMLELTAHRINAALAYNFRRLGLDASVFKRSNSALIKALQGGKQLTRLELVSILKQKGIQTDNLGFLHILLRAEIDRIICSGGRRGRQFTYALLDMRAPQPKALKPNEALAELSERYFRSHGPATLQDFAWWSGLTTADAKAGLEMVKSQFTHETMDDQTYWFSDSKSAGRKLFSTVYLLMNYDEYVIGYTDRSAIFDISNIKKLDSRGSPLTNTIVINGQITGTWKRTMKAKNVVIELNPFRALTETEKQSLTKATERFGKFLQLPLMTG